MANAAQEQKTCLHLLTLRNHRQLPYAQKHAVWAIVIIYWILATTSWNRDAVPILLMCTLRLTEGKWLAQSHTIHGGHCMHVWPLATLRLCIHEGRVPICFLAGCVPHTFSKHPDIFAKLINDSKARAPLNHNKHTGVLWFKTPDVQNTELQDMRWRMHRKCNWPGVRRPEGLFFTSATLLSHLDKPLGLFPTQLLHQYNALIQPSRPCELSLCTTCGAKKKMVEGWVRGQVRSSAALHQSHSPRPLSTTWLQKGFRDTGLSLVTGTYDRPATLLQVFKWFSLTFWE
jgi:hypothetical protein